MAQEKPKRMSDVRENPCPICGGTSYTWGVTAADKPAQKLYTRPDGANWGAGRELFTRECNRCGNVQLFTRGL